MQDDEYPAYLKKQSYDDLLSISYSINKNTKRYAMVLAELAEREKLGEKPEVKWGGVRARVPPPAASVPLAISVALVLGTPPPIPEALPVRKLIGFTAASSILAPLGAILLTILRTALSGHFYSLGISFLLASLALLQMVLGLCAAILSLVAAKPDERKSVLPPALTGICANGFLLLLVVLGAHAGSQRFAMSPQRRLDIATKRLATAPNEAIKFQALDDAAKESFEVGRADDAGKYATELLALAPKYLGNSNYGNAIHDGNLVLGRIALKEGRIDEAKQRLLEAGKSPGSPEMNRFGTNMSLAKDLLEKGERDVVLQYFESCRKFWPRGRRDLDRWTKAVQAGRIPDFGRNLAALGGFGHAGDEFVWISACFTPKVFTTSACLE